MEMDMIIMEHEKSKYKKLCTAVDRVVFMSNVNGIKAESGAQVNVKCIFLFILFRRMEFRRWFSIVISMDSLLLLLLLLHLMFRSLSICIKSIELCECTKCDRHLYQISGRINAAFRFDEEEKKNPLILMHRGNQIK